MSHRMLFTISFAALMSLLMAQGSPYSRTDELSRIEAELRRIDTSPSAVPSDFRERLRMRLQVESDQDYVRAQKHAGVDALVAVSEELHHSWQTDSPSGYIAVLGVASSLLLDFSSKSDVAAIHARRFGSNILALLPSAPISAASMGAGILANEHTWMSDLPNSSLLDLQPRTDGLNGILAVLDRVDRFTRAFSPEVELAKLSRDELLKIKSGEVPTEVGGRRLTYEEQGRYRDLLQQIQEHRSFAKTPSDGRGEGFTGHQGKLEKALAAFIQKRYALEPGDLDEVQAALEKHVKDPALKERLILAAYKGTNPFLGRTINAKAVAVGGAQTSTTTVGPAIQQGTVANSPKQATSRTVSGRRTEEADTLPLATTSGVSVGQGALWVAFAGAAAFIVLVFWRAQSRGASGGPK